MVDGETVFHPVGANMETEKAVCCTWDLLELVGHDGPLAMPFNAIQCLSFQTYRMGFIVQICRLRLRGPTAKSPSTLGGSPFIEVASNGLVNSLGCCRGCEMFLCLETLEPCETTS